MSVRPARSGDRNVASPPAVTLLCTRPLGADACQVLLRAEGETSA